MLKNRRESNEHLAIILLDFGSFFRNWFSFTRRNWDFFLSETRMNDECGGRRAQ